MGFIPEGFENARSAVIDFAAVLDIRDRAVAPTTGEGTVGHPGKHADSRSVDQVIGLRSRIVLDQ